MTYRIWKSLARTREVIQILNMFRLVSLLGLLWMNLVPSLMACPGCKEPSNVAGASDVGGISAGFSWSVLFMLCSVASIVGGMIFMIVRSCRQLAARGQMVSARPN
jgi:magnesium-transporting ATPase (P-type)